MVYDLAVIGAGAGGIACAKSAVKSGLKTVLISSDDRSFGGTCINKGCIPTKFFLNQAKRGKSWEEIFSEKNILIAKIKDPVIKFFTAKGVDIVYGNASFLDKDTVLVNDVQIKAKDFIIATGSIPRPMLDVGNAIAAEGIFNLPSIGKKILVIGAGYIGMEIAALLNRLGHDVSVVEKEDRVLSGFDARLANRFRIIQETKGVKVTTAVDFNLINFIDFDLVISAIGRMPDYDKLNLNNIGIKLDERGWIMTDKHMRTSVDNIYACGDVTGKKMLAYTAEHQAAICVKNISRHVVEPLAEENYHALSYCVFSIPQIAHCGVTEQQAKDKNIKYRVIKTNFLKFSSAYVYDDTDGYLQVLIDDQGVLIGADIISNSAGELISVLAVAINGKLTIKQLKECLLVHPTLSEIITMAVRDED